tara:strand:- start:5294 stop:7423 length:2130 start_codon:yes stop_codon:yes gene_type:complete
MSPSKFLFSVCQYFLISILCVAKEYDTLIETSLLVNLDTSVENSNRRYSTSYQQFGKENLINDELNAASLSPNPDLSSSLELVYNTLDENSLFDAFDHTLSYSIDLKNNGSYGDPESSSSVLKDNLNIAINSCIKRAEDLNIDIRTIAENISSRTIENFIVNPKGVSNWSGSTPRWLETLAEIVTTSSLNSFTIQNQETIIPLYSEVFTDSVLDLYNLDSNNPNFHSTNLYPGIETVSNDPSEANEVMLFGGDTDGFYKFDPLKTKIFASSTAGLVKVAAQQSIVSSNVDPIGFEDLASTMDAIDSIGQSYFNFLKTFDGDHTLFTYELTKSFALGASTAALNTALDNTNQRENVTPEIFLEFTSEQIGKTVMLNSLDSPNLSIVELAEASAIGNAIGTQFTTISYNEHNLDPKFAGFNRDTYARISSKGMARGTIASISEKIENFSTKENKNQDSLVSEVASHSAKGSVYGNTTLAIYNPTPKELLSIISNSARGAAEGSTNVLSLNNVEKSQGTTEGVVVQVARASAHGSALATAFGMVVLNDAMPDTLSYDRKTIAAIESASYGSAYGAITGAIASGVPDTVIIKQASTQGATEGALIGSGLGTTETVEDFNEEGTSYQDVELASKKNIIKAVAESSSNASSSAGEGRATKTIRSNSKNMILLMRKFNINPRTTNPTKIYQKSKSQDREFDSDFPLTDKFRAASPI